MDPAHSPDEREEVDTTSAKEEEKRLKHKHSSMSVVTMVVQLGV